MRIALSHYGRPSCLLLPLEPPLAPEILNLTPVLFSFLQDACEYAPTWVTGFSVGGVV